MPMVGYRNLKKADSFSPQILAGIPMVGYRNYRDERALRSFAEGDQAVDGIRYP